MKAEARSKKKIELTEEEEAFVKKLGIKKRKTKKLVKTLRKRPRYVGSTKCNGSCHDPYYKAWKNSPHGKTYQLLKPGQRAEAKKRVNLDPEKDYTSSPLCLRCHTTGYRQSGGFRPAGTKSRKGRDISTRIDPEEPNKEQVGCEMCHSVAGGRHLRAIMKSTRGKFSKSDTEQYGQRWDYENACTRCHTHSKTPFQPEVHEKYKFDFKERVKHVHPVDTYWSEDNQDQKLEHIKERNDEVAISETKPLEIENFIVKKGRLRFQKSSMPYDRKKKTFRYQEE
ncbi:MAG: cytochrome C-554 [Candidatus Nitrohelix vancouverensis]|uniref:Cytochrome C-554 n=1 Tax=Candidatus Nitrohelix vancouverensis TaxID=2705534 RepID=A0A7T0G4V7_9BACT|nr:MAG: cytochrome C-554 [Candidatus Nitrohelix vancouverensis]